MIEAQMKALKESGLEDAASEIYVGVNGCDADALAVACMVPSKAIVICHGQGVTSEIPTMNIIKSWVPNHPKWHVFYHHAKGVSSKHADGWRMRMEHHTVWRWRECVAALENGCDACGCHWLTPEQFPGSISSPFFGGAFWWVTSEYLSTLPPLPEPTWGNRYESENWIGRGPRRPKIHDFHTGWPTP